MKVLKTVRILFATLMFLACLAIFLDFTGLMQAWLGWVAQIQFVPAILGLNVVVFIVLMALTFVFGRLYCSIICPLGIFQDLFASFRGKKRKYKFWKQTKTLRIVRYGFLGLFILCLAAGLMSIVAILEPYSTFGRIVTSILSPAYDAINNVLADIAASHESYAFYSVDIWIRGTSALVLAIITSVGLAIAAIFTGRGYCNTVCPVGTVLGLVSKFSLFKIKIDEKTCKSCGQCTAKCKAHCIDFKNKTVDHELCVVCFNCLGTCKLNGITYTPSLANMCLKKSQNAAHEKDVKCDESPSKDEENIDMDKSAESNTEVSQNVTSENQTDIPSKTESEPESNDDKVHERRQFMTAAATASAGLLLSPALACAAPESDLAKVTRKDPHPRESLIIPPGAKSFPAFKRRCTGCQLCVRACHNKVLRISDDSRLQFLQPTLSFERGYCRPTCNDCSKVCPTGALTPISLAQKSSTQIGRAIWNKDICLSATQGAHCRTCGRACPNGAISFVVSTTPAGKKCKVPAVDLERCIGCGACEYVCPARPLAAIHVEGNMQHREI